MNLEGSRLLHMIQAILRYHGIKGNVATSREGTEIEDRFDTLVDANDQLLERIGIFLDEASGIKKDDNPLVVASVTPRAPLSGSWNRNRPTKSPSSFRLLAARNIQRPQLKFKDKIDNTASPFVPKIKYKPNALKPLPESILDAQSESIVHSRADRLSEEDLNLAQFPHPYQYELDNWQPSAEQLQAPAEEVLSVCLDDTPLHILTEVSDLVQCVDVLRECKELAVDLEHHSYRSYMGITCLMQISTRREDYIIDTLALRSDLHILNEVFTDPNIVKVLHGADSDVEWLQRDLGVYIVNMFDTGQASRVLNMPRCSLAYLLLHYCNVDVDKQYQLADWRIRPLPTELVRYAREDTHYLLYIYDKMKAELITQGNEHNNLLYNVIQRSTELCKKRYEKWTYREEQHLELYRKNKKRFNNRQLETLKGMYAWRNKIARLEDESIGYVLPNHMMLQISSVLPRERAGILACCNPIPPLVRQSLPELHEIIQTARELPLSQVETVPLKPAPLQPGALQHPKYDPTSLLHCPHDSSHQEKQTKCPVFTLDDNLIAQGSSMFSKARRVVQTDVQVLTKPQISLFDWVVPKSHNNSNNVKSTKTAVCSRSAAIASNIAALLRSPFEKYLLGDTDTTAEAVPRVSSVLTPCRLGRDPTDIEWRLLPASVKAINPVVKVVTTPLIPIIDHSDEEKGIIPLSQQMKVRKKKSKKRGSDGFDSGPLSKQPALSIEEVEEGFQPHDYSQAHLTAANSAGGAGFSKKSKNDKKKKKKKDYDPSDMAEDSFKTPSRPYLNPASGKKSQVFGSNKEAPKIQWPKR